MFLQNALLIRQHKLAIEKRSFLQSPTRFISKESNLLARGNEDQELSKRRRDDPIVIDYRI